MTASAPGVRPILAYRPSRIRHAAWLLALALAMVAQVTLASDLQVSPISLEFAPTEQAQGVWLSNTGTAPVRAQVRVQQWSQEGGQDQLAPTHEVTASPPIVEIAPGQNQLVRIIRLQPTPAAREQTYRLLVDELPSDAPRQDAGLQFLLRYSIPVFVQPQGSVAADTSKPAPRADLTRVSYELQGAGKDAVLQIVNQGNRRIRISELSYLNTDGSRAALVPGLLGYVLAGQTMRWPLPLPANARPGGSFRAKFNNDPEDQSLPLVTAVR